MPVMGPETAVAVVTRGLRKLRVGSSEHSVASLYAHEACAGGYQPLIPLSLSFAHSLPLMRSGALSSEAWTLSVERHWQAVAAPVWV